VTTTTDYALMAENSYRSTTGDLNLFPSLDGWQPATGSRGPRRREWSAAQ
jgi:hypothetical protein